MKYGSGGGIIGPEDGTALLKQRQIPKCPGKNSALFSTLKFTARLSGLRNDKTKEQIRVASWYCGVVA